jgi:predicted transposase/invertase (TIGR01784 family)
MNERKIKNFEELTIVDDFMFGAVMSDPDNLKPLLEYILDIKIKQITYPELQKTIDLTYDSKGIRLDVYCEDDRNTVYSVEIQVADQQNLAKRIRYYRSMIDLNIIGKGENYKKLKKSYVIFICCFDPFGQNQYMYFFQNQCREIPTLFLNDETYSVILNVKGTQGNINQELKSALQYMAGQQPKEEYAKKLDNAVKTVKVNEKWRREYMTLAMKISEEKEISALATKISTIRNGMGVVSDDTLIQILDIEKAQFDRIVSMIQECPDKNDEDIAEIIVNSDF